MPNIIKMRPFEASEVDSFSTEMTGQRYKMASYAEENSKFWAAKKAYDNGFKYFRIDDFQLTEGCYVKNTYDNFTQGNHQPNIARTFGYKMKFTCLKDKEEGALNVDDYYNKETVKAKNSQFIRKIMSVVGIAGICVLLGVVSIIFYLT